MPRLCCIVFGLNDYHTLMTAILDKGRERLLGEPDLRGRLVESCVGARLLARSGSEGFEVVWWRDGVDEVDFVQRKGAALTAVEVKGVLEQGTGAVFHRPGRVGLTQRPG